MRDLTLALSADFSKKKTSTIASRVHLNFVLLALIVVLGLTYLFVVNSLSSKGYEIKVLEQQLNLLQTEQKKLQLDSSNLQSINLIESKAAVLNFVPTTNVTYLKDGNFALK